MTRARRRILGTLAVAAVVVAAGWWLFLRGDVIRVPDELPPGFPARGFDHGPFDRLLLKFVNGDGHVSYGRWHADGEAMRSFDRYLAAVARYSPDNAPERFPTKDDRLAFWVNVYNACVIKGVLAHWPITSVHDVQGPIEPKAGFGFFWRLRFVIGGETINLYHLEHKFIRTRFPDPRVHFLLNCASKGCPPLRRAVPFQKSMERELEVAKNFYVHDSVRVDPVKKTVTTSALLDWYAGDFRPTPLDWLRRSTELNIPPDFTLEFTRWDWSLNGS